MDDLEAAVRLLLDEPRDLIALGRLWRQHAAVHLTTRLDTDLRGGVPRWTGESQALGVIKGAARDLREAAEALGLAAERFRSLGLGYHANRTYHAGRAASAAADALDPV